MSEIKKLKEQIEELVKQRDSENAANQNQIDRLQYTLRRKLTNLIAAQSTEDEKESKDS